MTNWYDELKDIDALTPIMGIAVYSDNQNRDRYSRNKIDILFNSLEEAKEYLDYEFDSGYGGSEGPWFTAWTKDRVYFPCTYDGSEWISNVPRNPCEESTSHIGGE
ncbi:MAG: hypothetical protein R3250_04055 [Melioribacteraceae bacterium]|nr:hypothetical protein [Melioribacteraceae bacterium]